MVPRSDDDPLAVATDPAMVLPRRVRWWAQEDPDRPFMTEVTGRTATYGEFWDEVRRWATLLRAHGVAPGDRVLSMLPSSIDAQALWLGAGCIGAMDVPVNFELRGTFLDHALCDPGSVLCFTRPEHVGIPAASNVPGIQVVGVERDGSLTSDLEPTDLGELPMPGDPSCIIYTSGTTGPSKGVVVRWAQMSATIGRIPRSWFSADDVVYAYHPMFHITGRSPMPSMTDVGGRLVLRERFSASEFWDDVRRLGCTSTTVNTSLLLGAPERDDDRDNPLRIAFTAGNRAHANRFAQRFGVQMAECYGSTEAGFPIVLREFPTDGSRPCGWLRRGYEARIVDDAGVEVPHGDSGELLIRPPAPEMILREYFNAPEQTAEALVDGWYHTGDRLRRRDDGGFEFVDRIKDTIRRMGENISSVALEAAVLADPDVVECAAIGVPDPVTGQDVMIVVVPHPAAVESFDPAQFAERLAESLPKYMRPEYVVVVDELPRTPNNKVRKVGLLATLDLTSPRAWRRPARR